MQYSWNDHWACREGLRRYSDHGRRGDNKAEGAPTIAQRFRESLRLPNGEILGAEFVQPPPPPPPRKDGFIALKLTEGQETRVNEQDYLMRRAIEQPIPTNGATDGFVMAVFRDVANSSPALFGSALTLEFTDVNETK